MTILHTPGSADSLGDLARKLAHAYGRPWPALTMSEIEAWHVYTVRLVTSLYRGWRGHFC